MAASPRRPPASLSGAGLVLARWQASDRADLEAAVAASRPHLSPWLAWANEDSPEAIASFLRETVEGWEGAARFEYGIRSEQRAGALLGSAGLMARIGPGGLELGYWVGKRHTRQGIATRASALLVEAAFRLPSVARVEIHHDEANRASAGVPAALGFRRVGVFPQIPVGAPAETGREVRWRMQEAEFPASAAAAIARDG